MLLLEIDGLTYGAGDKTILDDFSMTIEPSEVHALLGTNGTGKSTLAYLIMGCEGYMPSSGEIIFEGKTINTLKIQERSKLGITMAWQEPVRFEGISVSDYLRLKNKDINPSYYLEMVGLHPELYLHRMVDKSLSGGERKRIELASILALNPKLAILDEPDSGIDMLSTQDIVNVISAFKDNGSSVLLITHREEIVLIADRASQICNGKIVCTGNPDKVAEYYKSRKCFVCDGEVCAYV
ncbi:MAG: ABC transporter ATP-binding protein [Thermodesulfovibrionales bacterium]|nr:ABC transporter ATP-binding protein [Nitrospinota bacterium]MCG2709883.1 ABC transporter ATP-binding protein [Thermodesulfovibrionales bacterium]MDP3048117.1 ABC transporter ATP-binding protein [Thermodesulfovibrionales bacterium]